MENEVSGTALMARESGDPMRSFWHRLERVLLDHAEAHPLDWASEMPPHKVHFVSGVTDENPLEEFFKANADCLAAFLPKEFMVVDRLQLDAVLKASVPIGGGNPKMLAAMLDTDGIGRLAARAHYARMEAKHAE